MVELQSIFNKCKKKLIRENPDLDMLLEGVRLSPEDIEGLTKVLSTGADPWTIYRCFEAVCEAFLVAYCRKDVVDIYEPDKTD